VAGFLKLSHLGKKEKGDRDYKMGKKKNRREGPRNGSWSLPRAEISCKSRMSTGGREDLSDF